MVLNVLISTSIKRLPLRNSEYAVKSCNKFLKVFLSEFKLKCSRKYSTEKNIDIFATEQMQKYLNFLANEKSENKYQLSELVKLLKDKTSAEEELKALENMSSEGDKELEKLIELEKKKCSKNIEEVKNSLLHYLISFEDENDNRNVELKVLQGIGGEESKLFSTELFQMYINYAEYKNWECIPLGNCILISGKYVFGHLKYEAGVHRVQRVPETEKSGRTHTSTCSVVVLPQPKPTEIKISDKDLIVEKTTSCGAGGQNVNKRETCVRVKHIPTGIVVENQTERYQYANLKLALGRLKTILFNMEQEKIMQEKRALKKHQAGINDYADKIRTYHFSSNRITDHRISYTTYNIKDFLEGNKDLDLMISKVREFQRKKDFLLHVEDVLHSEEYKNFEKCQTVN